MPEQPTEPGPDSPTEAVTDHGTDGAAEPERPEDGLDLARTFMKAAAGSTPAARRRRRRTDRAPRRGQTSGPRPDDRDPQPLGGEVSRLVTDRGWELDLRVRGVFGRWPELVGDQVADHSTPESFTEGRLVVRAHSTAWATQLRLLAPTLVKRLNEDLGHGTVTAIEVLGPHGPTWKKGPRSVRDGRGPRDTYG